MSKTDFDWAKLLDRLSEDMGCFTLIALGLICLTSAFGLICWTIVNLVRR